MFTAGDIAREMSGFEVMNPDLVICHLDPDASFTIVLTINKGRGWVPAEENVTPQDDINTIAIDSIYTPIKKRQIHRRKLPRRPENRLRQTDSRDKHQWVDIAQGCRQRSSKDIDLSFHAVQRRENHS